MSCCSSSTLFDFLFTCVVSIHFVFYYIYYTFADYTADIRVVMPALTELLNTIIVIITQLTRLFSQTYRDI